MIPRWLISFLFIACSGLLAAEPTPVLERAIENNDALAVWNLTDPLGELPWTPEMNAVSKAVNRGAGEVFDVLTYRGAPVGAFDAQGRNLLFPATYQGRLDLFRKIEAAGARIDQQDAEGWRLVHMAAQSNRPEMLGYLLGRGLDPVSATEAGLTPLMVACRAGQLEQAQQLLGWGANPFDQDYRGRDVHWYATLANNPELLALLDAEINGLGLTLPEPPAVDGTVLLP